MFTLCKIPRKYLSCSKKYIIRGILPHPHLYLTPDTVLKILQVLRKLLILITLCQYDTNNIIQPRYAKLCHPMTRESPVTTFISHVN